MKTIHRNDAIHTARSRDAALRRLRNVNRWMIAGAAIVTGVLTDVAANAFPGHKTTARTSSRHGTSSQTTPLQPPAKAPTTATQPSTPAPSTSEPSPSSEAPAPSEEPSRPAEEAPAPETHAETHEEAPREEAPREETAPAPVERAPEPSEPVVSGGS